MDLVALRIGDRITAASTNQEGSHTGLVAALYELDVQPNSSITPLGSQTRKQGGLALICGKRSGPT